MTKLFNLLNNNTFYPSKAYSGDAGYDVYMPYDCIIEPHSAIKFPLDLSIEWDKLGSSVVALTFPRSSSLTDGRMFVTSGVIDFGYTGSIHFTGTNVSDDKIVIPKGTRVMQILFVKLSETLDENNVLKEGTRHDRSFGSSGK